MDNQILYQEEFVLNSRGLKLFTCRWLPASNRIKALVFLCHGYGVECSVFMKGTGIRLAEAGFAVFGIDYEGHGKSEGVRCYIKDFSTLVGDSSEFFKTIREKDEYKNKARFLLGESMGGVVALRVHMKEHNDWDGAILVAPMCKISDNMKPSPFLISMAFKLANIIPLWKIVPTRDIINIGFKDPFKKEEMRSNPYSYQERPRLKTGLELLQASIDMEKSLEKVNLPFLVLHGEADLITDPSVSKQLYKVSKSLDKTLITYPNMWHGLLFGEPDENIDLVIQDITMWLNMRVPLTNNGECCNTPLLTHMNVTQMMNDTHKCLNQNAL